jgi:hypothetical protein
MQDADQTMLTMKQRLEQTERRLSQLIAFFSNVANNPTVLAQMVSTAQQSQAYLADSDARRKKRRHDGVDNVTPGSESDAADNQQLIAYQPVDVASFFQQLLVSPLPEEGHGKEASPTQALEEHFNGFNLRNQDENVSSRGAAVTIHDYVSPANTPRERQESEIEIPRDIRGGVPSIGVSEVQNGLHAGNLFMPRPESSGEESDDERVGAVDRAEPLGVGCARGIRGSHMGSLPLPPPPPGIGASLSIDGLDADDLGVDELQDMLKGASASLEYGQADADEWQAMLEDMSLSPMLPRPT